MLEAGKTLSIGTLWSAEKGAIANQPLLRGETTPLNGTALGAGAQTPCREHVHGHLALGFKGDVRMFRDDGHGDGAFKTVGHLQPGFAVVTEPGWKMGVSAEHESVFAQVPLPDQVNLAGGLHMGEPVRMAELVPYRDGEVHQQVLLEGEGVRLVAMAFDAQKGLSAHKPPMGARALFMALEGEATVVYGDHEHTVHAGEQFVFEPTVTHSVRCEQRFKMALLLLK